MFKAVRIASIVLASISLFNIAAGCQSSPPPSESEVRAYADPIAEEILTAINTENYSQFSNRFDDKMKAGLNEQVFKQETVPLIKSKIGDYVSKEFWKVERSGQYIVAYYKADFTQEGDATVRLVFEDSAGEKLVSGLWFDSPKLRQQ